MAYGIPDGLVLKIVGITYPILRRIPCNNSAVFQRQWAFLSTTIVPCYYNGFSVPQAAEPKTGRDCFGI
jgi:hypothetical protein